MFFFPLFAYLLCLDVKDANLRVRSLIAKYIFVFRTISTTRGTTYETTLVTAIVTWSWKEENQIRLNDETLNICFHKCIELQAPGTKVIRVESDNFGDPLIQKFLQNQLYPQLYKRPWLFCLALRPRLKSFEALWCFFQLRIRV